MCFTAKRLYRFISFGEFLDEEEKYLQQQVFLAAPPLSVMSIKLGRPDPVTCEARTDGFHNNWTSHGKNNPYFDCSHGIASRTFNNLVIQPLPLSFVSAFVTPQVSIDFKVAQPYHHPAHFRLSGCAPVTGP